MRRASVLIGLTVAAILAVSSCAVVGGGGGTYTLTAFFPRTINLFESSQVRVLGLEAGTVNAITVEGDRIRVELHVDDDIPVPADVQATIVPFSLIGERYVQLYPAWTEGSPQAQDGDVIPSERTSVPVEPDEALAALKEFLDALDPDGTGRLVTNLSEALDGQGESLNGALEGLATTLQALADEDDSLGRLVDHFDEFAATLITRERQLGETMDAFAVATGVLAEERESIRLLVKALGDLSGDALDLVAEHGGALERDLEILGRVLRSVDANLDRVEDLLDSGPILVTGLRDAYNPEFHRTDLRSQYSPTVGQALEALGVPDAGTVCLPIDVDCTAEAPDPTSSSTSAGPVAPGAPVNTSGASLARSTHLAPDGGLDLAALIERLDLRGTAPRPPAAEPERSWWRALGGALLGVDW